MTFVPLLPELMRIVSKKENIQEGSNDFNDKASGVYNFSYALGTLVAPIVGGALDDVLKYRSMCDVMGFFSLIIGVLFFLTNIRSCKFTLDPEFKGEEVAELKLLENSNRINDQSIKTISQVSDDEK